MRLFVFTSLLALLPVAAMAADAAVPPQPPLETALGQSLTEMMAQMVQWRARAIDDERHIAELEEQQKAAKPDGKPQAKP